MNLLNDPWLTIRLRDGQVIPAKPSDVANPEACDIVAPRPDFRGALYQFVIGLLQTTFAPEDEDEWYERWQAAPTPEQVQAKFSSWAHAFELKSDGPAFMQDFDSLTAEPNRGEEKSISALLIDAPGDKTIRDNLDFFTKRDTVEAMCSACAATALFVLQANAPSGGVGHRVSMRGGGPLTSLVMPAQEPDVSLWQKLWLNILSRDDARQPGAFSDVSLAKIFPWLAPTRSSEKKDRQTTPEHASGLQAYWSMPRRVRLDWDAVREGECDVCGASSSRLLTRFRMKNYGINYLGWVHPLTPYYHDPKKKELPLSVKGQKGGISYRHWLSLTLGNDDRQPEAATVVRRYIQYKSPKISDNFELRIWAFGYDTDNMKARCWYDATLPIHRISENSKAEFALAVQSLLNVAIEASRLLSRYVRAAWSERPSDLPDEPAIALSFWQATEADFYRSIAALANVDGLEAVPLATVQRGWLMNTKRIALDLFDDWVSGEYAKDWDIERTIRAKSKLSKELGSAKPMKELWKTVGRYVKEAA